MDYMYPDIGVGKRFNCFELLTNPNLLHLDYIKIPANQTSLKFDDSTFYAKPIISKWTRQIPNRLAYIGSFDRGKCAFPMSSLIQKTNYTRTFDVYHGQAIVRGWKNVNILVAKVGHKFKF